jgi:hypothetical protein
MIDYFPFGTLNMKAAPGRAAFVNLIAGDNSHASRG